MLNLKMLCLVRHVLLLLLLLQFTEPYNLDGTESLAKRRDFRKGGITQGPNGLCVQLARRLHQADATCSTLVLCGVQGLAPCTAAAGCCCPTEL
jgi:hypothetical protein